MVLPSLRPDEGPLLQWLDGRRAEVDLDGLRKLARAASAAAGASYSSRSYSYPYALIASHRAPVGVDIERVEPCDEAFARSICTPTEDIHPPRGVSRDRYLTSLWSSKEALAKALGDALSYDPRRLESPLGWPGGQAGPWRAGELSAGPEHVAWVCWLGSPDG